MAKVTIGGVEYTLEPYKLRELRAAAPAMDAFGALSNEPATPGQAIDRLTPALGIILPGLRKQDASWTIDRMEAELSLSEATDLNGVIIEIMREAGLKPAGEPVAGSQAPLQTEAPAPAAA